MGCLRSIAYRIGCSLVGLALVIAAIIYREQVVAIYHKLRGTPLRPEAVYVAPASDAGSEARRQLDRLDDRGGPAYVDLTAGQLAALIEEAVGREGRGLDSIGVGLLDDEIRVRGSLDLSSVPRNLLGPMRNMVGSREPVVIGGPLASDSTGRLFLTVTTLRVADFPFPRGTIARLLRETRVRGIEGNRIPLPAMRGVGDVRVTREYVRVYRSSAR